MLPSAAGHPKGALSVDGRGRSEDAIDTGRGLLGSRSEKVVGSSMLEPNILNGRRLLAVEFRAGAGALPSTASLTAGPLKTFQLEEKLTRRCLLLLESGSSVDRGNE
jgi:hypothetical protein